MCDRYIVSYGFLFQVLSNFLLSIGSMYVCIYRSGWWVGVKDIVSYGSLYQCWLTFYFHAALQTKSRTVVECWLLIMHIHVLLTFLHTYINKHPRTDGGVQIHRLFPYVDLLFP